MVFRLLSAVLLSTVSVVCQPVNTTVRTLAPGSWFGPMPSAPPDHWGLLVPDRDIGQTSIPLLSFWRPRLGQEAIEFHVQMLWVSSTIARPGVRCRLREALSGRTGPWVWVPLHSAGRRLVVYRMVMSRGNTQISQWWLDVQDPQNPGRHVRLEHVVLAGRIRADQWP